jgi:hypothetical protein
MPKPLIIQFTPIRSCLVNLPGKWVNALLDQKKVQPYSKYIHDQKRLMQKLLLVTSKCYFRDRIAK